MQRNITVTKEQLDYIVLHRKRKSTLEVAKELGLTKGVVDNNYRIATFTEKPLDETIFDVNKKENWII